MSIIKTKIIYECLISNLVDFLVTKYELSIKLIAANGIHFLVLKFQIISESWQFLKD